MSLKGPERLGAKPRIRTVPPYPTSAGREAIDLAASAGLILDDWQQDVLIDSLGERPDGLWSAFEVGLVVPRQNGKGAIIEARELAGMFLFGEKMILHSAHEFKTAAEAFRRILGWIENSDDLRKRVKKVMHTHGAEGIELRNGARLHFVARNKGSGRGFSGDLNILDEAFALTADQLAALLPTMSARPNPQIWYTSTPPLEPAAQLVALRKRGKEGSPRLAYFEWSPPDVYDPADREVWRATNPAMGIRIAEEFVVAEHATFLNALEEFKRERLGEWPPSADGQWQVIREPDWSAAEDPKSQIVGQISIAVDVNPSHTYSAVAVAGRTAEGNLHVEVIEHKPGTGWAVDRVRRLAARWGTACVVVDAGAPAGALIAGLEEAGIEVAKPGAREMAHACGQFLTAVTGDGDGGPRTLRHLGQGELTAAVAGAIKRPLGNAWAWDRRGVNIDICPLVAVTLAAWGYVTHLPESYDALANIW